MKWATAVDTSLSLHEAIERAAAGIFKGLGHLEPDLIIVYVSSHHSGQYERVPELLGRQFESAVVFGCAASAVIGGGQEVEDLPAVSLTGAILPGVDLHTLHLDAANLPPTYAEASLWEQTLGVQAANHPAFLILCDPYSFDTEAFLKGLDRAYPNSPKAGGIASAASRPGLNALYLRGKVQRSGAIVLALSGDIEMHTIISQGSRPIGEPMFVTSVHENLIRKLDGVVPRDLMEALFEKLSADDRDLITDSLFLGIALADQGAEYDAGDCLVSGILGMDPESGSLWVNAQVPANHVVQFHLRDAATAERDLEYALARLTNAMGKATPAGAMLFSCTGRGIQFFGQPDYDSSAFRRLVADVPIGGCFCSGEIGPLRRSHYLHGYTSSFAVFSPRRAINP